MTRFIVTICSTRQQREFSGCLAAVAWAAGRFATVQRQDRRGPEWRDNGRAVYVNKAKGFMGQRDSLQASLSILLESA